MLQITEKNTSGLTRELELVVNASTVEEKLQEHLNELSPKVSIRGFRPGKAPMEIVRKQHGRNGLSTVMQPLMSQLCNDVVVERKERQYSKISYYLPEKWDDDLLAGQDISVRLEYEVYPEFETLPFTEFKVERVIYDVTEEVVESYLKQMAGDAALFEQPTDSGTAELGDRLTVSFDIKSDGKKVDELSTENSHIILGQSNTLNQLDSELTGKSVGEYFISSITLPTELVGSEYAGKDVEIEIHVIKLEKKKDFKVDDELLKRFNCKDESELRDFIKKQIEENLQYRSNQDAKDELSEQLLAKHEFMVTDAMVDMEVESGWNDYKHMIESDSSSVAGDPLTESEYDKKWRGHFEQKLRLTIILMAYAEKFDIKVTEQELRNSIQSSIMNHANPTAMKEYLDIDVNLLDYSRLLNASLIIQKALDYIYEHIEITDKKIDSSDVTVTEQENTETEV